jgi:hypothetical protein
MTIETVPATDTRYHLINFDRHGDERVDDPDAADGRLSDTLADLLSRAPITDVLLMSHGWQGDVPAAKRQYDAWTRAMLDCTADIERIRARRSGFAPLLIGLHWPSLPWGNENPTAGAVPFAPGEPNPVDRWVDQAGADLTDTPRARDALRALFVAAIEDIAPDELPDEVLDAYQVLQDEVGLDAAGPAGAPGNDLDGFDPEAIFDAADAAEQAFAAGPLAGALLAPLRQLSFWRMKARARGFGEGGAARLLRRLQGIAAGRDLRFHLMGHSFGCIVVSGALRGADQGADEGTALLRPVDSLFLAQGALSLWAYCAEVPGTPGQPGYFNPLIAEGRVSGPIVTTRSRHDTAVRVFYPLGAGLAGQQAFAPGEDRLPRYGGIGMFGIQGPGIPIQPGHMLPETGDYGFQAGRVYNLDADDVINQGGGAVGAHNDIAKPAVAHAFWQAIS